MSVVGCYRFGNEARTGVKHERCQANATSKSQVKIKSEERVYELFQHAAKSQVKSEINGKSLKSSCQSEVHAATSAVSRFPPTDNSGSTSRMSFLLLLPSSVLRCSENLARFAEKE